MIETPLEQGASRRSYTSNVSGENDIVEGLGEVIALAARRGRLDVVGELASIVAKLAGEERERINAANGVASLDAARAKRDTE